MMLLPQGPNFLILWCFNNEAVLDSPAETVVFKWPLSSACFCATQVKSIIEDQLGAHLGVFLIYGFVLLVQC